MNAGELRHRIEIQSNTPALNEYRESAPCWTTETRVWASIKPVTGRESFVAQQINADATHQIKIRFYATLDVRNRFKFGKRIFDINSIINTNEQNYEQICVCKEAVGIDA